MEYGYRMIRITPKEIGKPFELWVDELGVTNNKEPYIEIKVKIPQKEDIYIIYLNDDYTKKLSNVFDFGQCDVKDVLEFIEMFKELLIAHWNHKISGVELAMIIKYVNIHKYSLKDVIRKVQEDDF